MSGDSRARGTSSSIRRKRRYLSAFGLRPNVNLQMTRLTFEPNLPTENALTRAVNTKQDTQRLLLGPGARVETSTRSEFVSANNLPRPEVHRLNIGLESA